MSFDSIIAEGSRLPHHRACIAQAPVKRKGISKRNPDLIGQGPQ